MAKICASGDDTTSWTALSGLPSFGDGAVATFANGMFAVINSSTAYTSTDTVHWQSKDNYTNWGNLSFQHGWGLAYGNGHLLRHR